FEGDLVLDRDIVREAKDAKTLLERVPTGPGRVRARDRDQGDVGARQPAGRAADGADGQLLGGSGGSLTRLQGGLAGPDGGLGVAAARCEDQVVGARLGQRSVKK